MARCLPLFLLLATGRFVYAQEKPADPLAALRQAAEKSSAQWEALAKGLEPKIARMLPCDPNSHSAVEEVSLASNARLAALSAYLKAAAARAKDDTEGAKRVLAAQAALAGGWNTEYTEANQASAAIEAQVAELKESMRKRATLAGAEQVLVEIARIVKERGAKAEEQAGRKDALNAVLGDLVVACQDRQTALESESAQLDAEAARWTAYYIARLARSTTECTIINNPSQRKKQR
jgi:hypothetical protein